MNTLSLLSTVNARSTAVDLSGFATAGLWVRRVRSIPSLSEEAISLAAVLQTWNLSREMMIGSHDGLSAEISGPDLQPLWVYMIEVAGFRTSREPLCLNHPLFEVQPDEPVRLVALVSPRDLLVIGVLVETAARSRMLWLRAALSHRERV